MLLDINDAPLSPAALEADVAPERVELANLLIPSPYGGAGRRWPNSTASLSSFPRPA